jgi:hypothetical protein
VQQSGTADSTFASLSEGYSHRSNSTLEVDDPGADKLIASKNDLVQLVDKSKEAITGENAEGIKRELDGLIKLIVKRNEAVMRYNAGVQLLLQARADKTPYEGLQGTTGEKLLSIDPIIPAGRFWMDKAINGARYSAVEALTMGERSLRLWALIPPYSMSPLYQALPTLTLIASYSQKPEALFDACVESYGKTI